jgi:hypothetical protein
MTDHADTLRRAATLIRKRTEIVSHTWEEPDYEAMDGTYFFNGIAYETRPEVYSHIASFAHPTPALDVADWLDEASIRAEETGDVCDMEMAAARACLGADT